MAFSTQRRENHIHTSCGVKSHEASDCLRQDMISRHEYKKFSMLLLQQLFDILYILLNSLGVYSLPLFLGALIGTDHTAGVI